ncbi:class I SAM-dependent methyltransferase [Candidatus Beckwithbacteria bacterium]|nr:class I SAM-dependent methyltransferase [Candidatus Beckwithbacteria bacterium]
MFNIFNKIDIFLNKQALREFNNILQYSQQLIINSSKVTEIGFGSGAELIRYLKQGVNMFGIDISNQAVHNFKKQYPKYKNKVVCTDTLQTKTEAIYANALFEHLDNPDSFLKNSKQFLYGKSYLILRIPLLTSKYQYSLNNNFSDINFWKPCHRMLYTQKGMKILLEKHGFKIVKKASLPYFGYKVMNTMLKHGCEDIMELRNPMYEIKGVNSMYHYILILFQSLFVNLDCSDTIVIAQKKRL